MTPFFFGEGERRLLGVYDPPARNAGGATRAAVFCAPWGPDYTVSHGALRRLAFNLADDGRHVLRFDYFGAGDSAGEAEDADLAGWRDDIEMAIEELKGMSGALRVSLVGMRLGAALAAEVAADRTDIDRLALWDPVVSGPDYLRELEADHAEWVRERTRYDALPPTTVANRVCSLLSKELEAEIAAIDLVAIAPRLKAKILLVATEPQAAHEALIAALSGGKADRLTVETVTDRAPWRLNSHGFGGPMPSDALKRIAAWMA